MNTSIKLLIALIISPIFSLVANAGVDVGLGFGKDVTQHDNKDASTFNDQVRLNGLGAGVSKNSIGRDVGTNAVVDLPFSNPIALNANVKYRLENVKAYNNLGGNFLALDKVRLVFDVNGKETAIDVGAGIQNLGLLGPF